jgi:hypothetical protein
MTRGAGERLPDGDVAVLYIPDPCWHAVVSADDDLGITVTSWFKPPFLSLSSPQTVRRFVCPIARVDPDYMGRRP